MPVSIARITDIMRCPKCRCKLAVDNAHPTTLRCPNPQCPSSVAPFSNVAGQPVLIDFSTSIVDPKAFQLRGGGSELPRDDSSSSWKTKIPQFFFGRNHIAEEFSSYFLADLRVRASNPRVVIIGGGAIGSGINQLYAEQSIELIGFDIYASPNTTFVADAHRIPLADESVDGVWIQAVLEHVLDPAVVVSEIRRILKPGGTVFADTPFIQHVHEGAYDFTRFTLSGHRWLFRDFALIDAGISGGPGTAALLTLRWFVRAIIKNDKISTAIQLMFFVTAHPWSGCPGAGWPVERDSTSCGGVGERIDFA
jgi:SAM-dependent methyltransferase